MAVKKVTKSTAKEPVETPERLTRTSGTGDESNLENANIVSEEDIEEDYLQKYQYMREKPLGHFDSNPKAGKALIMKTNLLSQPKVRVMIPVDSGSDPSVPFSVQLNGYRLDLPRNQYIDVPEQVAEIIMFSNNQTLAAINNPLKISGNKAKETALN